jgi:hypothetical protein
MVDAVEGWVCLGSTAWPTSSTFWSRRVCCRLSPKRRGVSSRSRCLDGRGAGCPASWRSLYFFGPTPLYFSFCPFRFQDPINASTNIEEFDFVPPYPSKEVIIAGSPTTFEYVALAILVILAARFCFVFFAPADPFRIPLYFNELIVEALVDVIYNILDAGRAVVDDFLEIVSGAFRRVITA